MRDDEVLSVRAWTVTRPDSGFAVQIPELCLRSGDAAALWGPSGCGKTTAMQAMFGLVAGVHTQGDIQVLGADLPRPGSPAWRQLMFSRVAVVPQDARAALDPLMTLGRQLAQATGADAPAVADALAEIGIESPAELLRRHPHQVSGGQAQRCCFAVALLRAPRLVLADEPTASLDDQRLEDVARALDLLRRRTGTAVLVATHDLALLRAVAADPYVFEDGVFTRGAAQQQEWPAGGNGQSDGDVVLSGRGLGVERGGNWILRDFDIALPRGEITALVGPSGAGKTTLAKLLAGHLAPSRGEIDGPARATAVQLLFQDAYASLTPGRRIGDLVREVAVPGFDVAAEASRLGLAPELLARTAADLSGGERRRAALLRAMAVRPEVVILDEPTGSLDRATALPVMESLLDAQRTSGTTYLLITHDLELARAVADRVVRIEAGRCLE